MVTQGIGPISTEYQNKSAAAAWAFGELGTNPKIVNGVLPLVNSVTSNELAQWMVSAANETNDRSMEQMRQDREDAAERARRREQASRRNLKPLTKQRQTITQTQAPRWVQETTSATPTQGSSVLTMPAKYDPEMWKFYVLLVTTKA